MPPSAVGSAKACRQCRPRRVLLRNPGLGAKSMRTRLLLGSSTCIKSHCLAESAWRKAPPYHSFPNGSDAFFQSSRIARFAIGKSTLERGRPCSSIGVPPNQVHPMAHPSDCLAARLRAARRHDNCPAPALMPSTRDESRTQSAGECRGQSQRACRKLGACASA